MRLLIAVVAAIIYNNFIFVFGGVALLGLKPTRMTALKGFPTLTIVAATWGLRDSKRAATRVGTKLNGDFNTLAGTN